MTTFFLISGLYIRRLKKKEKIKDAFCICMCSPVPIHITKTLAVDELLCICLHTTESLIYLTPVISGNVYLDRQQLRECVCVFMLGVCM